MCEEVQVDKVLEVKPCAHPLRVAKPDVVIYKDEEHTLAIIEDYKPGQVNIHVNASVRNGRAGVGVYATPSKVMFSKTVVSSNQADAHLRAPSNQRGSQLAVGPHVHGYRPSRFFNTCF